MIQAETKLHVADNSGPRILRSISPLVIRGGKKTVGTLGDFLLGSVVLFGGGKMKGERARGPKAKSTPKSTLQLKSQAKLEWALLIRTKKQNKLFGTARHGGTSGIMASFDKNAVIIVNAPQVERAGGFAHAEPKGTRIFGPVPRKFRLSSLRFSLSEFATPKSTPQSELKPETFMDSKTTKTTKPKKKIDSPITFGFGKGLSLSSLVI